MIKLILIFLFGLGLVAVSLISFKYGILLKSDDYKNKESDKSRFRGDFLTPLGSEGLYKVRLAFFSIFTFFIGFLIIFLVIGSIAGFVQINLFI